MYSLYHHYHPRSFFNIIKNIDLHGGKYILILSLCIHYDIALPRSLNIMNMRLIILPRAEVPHDLDIVPLPPGTFLHQNRAFFYLAFFQCILNKFRLYLYHRRMPNA